MALFNFIRYIKAKLSDHRMYCWSQRDKCPRGCMWVYGVIKKVIRGCASQCAYCAHKCHICLHSWNDFFIDNNWVSKFAMLSAAQRPHGAMNCKPHVRSGVAVHVSWPWLVHYFISYEYNITYYIYNLYISICVYEQNVKDCSLSVVGFQALKKESKWDRIALW